MKSFHSIMMFVLALGMLALAAWQVLDYTKFRQAGARYTSADGTMACHAHNRLAEFVGHPDRLNCDYETR